jgi:hypothetical protein
LRRENVGQTDEAERERVKAKQGTNERKKGQTSFRSNSLKTVFNLAPNRSEKAHNKKDYP